MVMRNKQSCKYIVVHYSATAIERPYTYAQLERDHRVRGFDGIGYHAYFPRSGGRLAGRYIGEAGRFEQGAHSKGENDESVGGCFEGGLTLSNMTQGRNTMTPAQERELIEWIDDMLDLFGGDGIDPTKGPLVRGHRDMPGAATQCPGFDVTEWWAGIQAKRKKSAAGIWATLVAFFMGGNKR